MKSKVLLFSFLVFVTQVCLSQTLAQARYPFYVGVIGGYGSTTWQGLVPHKKNLNPALMLSTPIGVDEGGTTWGVLAGYELTDLFAVEFNFMQYADATVYFDPMSLFTFFHDGSVSLSTKTQAISLMGKLMLPIPHHIKTRIFSAVGIAEVHRKDIVIDQWRIGPTFNIGLNYLFTDHIMGELVGNFTTGYGESQLSPVDSYYPFLSSVTARLMYRF